MLNHINANHKKGARNIKPWLTASEACHRLALIEGQKENKYGNEGKMRKYISKYLGIFILLVGVLLYKLGNIASSHGLAVTGLLLSSLGFFVAIVEVLQMKLNHPEVAMVLNFFIPGLGFMYSRRWYFSLGGAVLFMASLHPQFPLFPILKIIAIAITNPSVLTLTEIILALCWGSLLAALAYFATKHAE